MDSADEDYKKPGSVETNIRNDASLLAGSVLSAVSAGLSLFFESPVLGVVTGTLLGAVVTVWAQSRTQKSSWKRELAVRNADNVYGPLYNEVTQTLDKIKEMSAQTGYDLLESPVWSQISSQYQYYFIPDRLREELQQFYHLMSKYRELVRSLFLPKNEVLDTVLKEASIFWKGVHNIEYGADLTAGGSTAPYWVMNSVLYNQHPKDIIAKSYPGLITNYAVIVTWRTNGATNQVRLTSKEDLEKFDKFFKQAVIRVQETKTVKGLKETLHELTESGLRLKERLLTYIQQPWSV